MTLSNFDSANGEMLHANGAPPFAGSPFGGPTQSTRIREIRISAIDAEDVSFRYTVDSDNRDLEASLRDEGQKQPILVLGGTPHRILDGFRRVASLRAVGRETVLADIRHVEDEDEAHRISFRRNVVERDLGPVQRGKAIRIAKRRGRALTEIATDFGLSVKQVRRYLALLELPPQLAEYVERDEVSMAHARVLGEATPANLEEWIRTYRRMRWSASRLREELGRAYESNGRPQAIFVQQQGSTLRVDGFSVDANTPEEERQTVLDQLKRAVAFLEQARTIHE